MHTDYRFQYDDFSPSARRRIRGGISLITWAILAIAGVFLAFTLLIPWVTG